MVKLRKDTVKYRNIRLSIDTYNKPLDDAIKSLIEDSKKQEHSK